jgi:prenyltransferase beta subunit
VTRFAAWALLVVAAVPAAGQTPADKKTTVTYLQSLQNKDGGFRPTAAAGESSLRATLTAARALKYFGGEVPKKDACKAFIARCFEKKSGGFADRPGGKPDAVVTAVGLMALVDLGAPRKEYEGPAIRYLADKARSFEEVRMAAAGLEAVKKRSRANAEWLKQLAKNRNADGTYGEGTAQARDTGGTVAAVLRLGGKVEARRAVVDAINAGQRADGGFGNADVAGSDLATTYRVMRAMMMLKEKLKNEDALRRFLKRCRNADGGYGVEPGKSSSAAATYFAGIVYHWLNRE